MLKMIHLIQNENMKLYRKVGTWVMIGLVVIALIAISCLNTFIDGKINEKQTKEYIEQGKVALNQPGISKAQKKEIETEIRVLESSLKNKVSPDRVHIFLTGIKGTLPLIACFMVIVAASIVSKEYSDGTIKLLLIRPASRTSILLSKYVTVLLSGIAMLFFHFLISGVVLNVLFKPGLFSLMAQELFTRYGSFSVELLLVLTLAFMISTVFRSQGLAIGLTLFLYLTGELILSFLARYFSWAKYLLFANWNLSQSYEGVDKALYPGLQGITTAFSIKVLIVYYLAFVFITWYTFNKRDVAL